MMMHAVRQYGTKMYEYGLNKKLSYNSDVLQYFRRSLLPLRKKELFQAIVHVFIEVGLEYGLARQIWLRLKQLFFRSRTMIS
jgi:hypothetical protein